MTLAPAVLRWSACAALFLAATVASAGEPMQPAGVAPTPPVAQTLHVVAPPFRWGWFGATRHHPRPSWHRDYNGELMRWSALRRY